jgi:hypothetical protein
MRLETAKVELAVNRRGFFMETGAFAFYWDFNARPIFSRKTA